MAKKKKLNLHYGILNNIKKKQTRMLGASPRSHEHRAGSWSFLSEGVRKKPGDVSLSPCFGLWNVLGLRTSVKGDVREASGQRGEQGSGSAAWRHIPSGASASGTPRPFFSLLPSWTASAGRDILVPVDEAQLLLQFPGALWSGQLCHPTLLWPQRLGGIREGDLGH